MTDLPLLKVSVAELRARGVALRGDEAIAVVLAVGERLQWRAAPPAPASVVLRSDGLVDVHDTPDADATAESYARLLDQLLPEPGAGHGPVAGGVRMLIARATGRTELPPVVGAQQFAQSLRRFAPASGPDAIVQVMLRWAETTAGQAAAAVPRVSDRRASGPTTSQLRSFLQEGDLERWAMRQHLARTRTPAAAPAATGLAEEPVLLSTFGAASETTARPMRRSRVRGLFVFAMLLLIAAAVGTGLGRREELYEAALAAIRSIRPTPDSTPPQQENSSARSSPRVDPVELPEPPAGSAGTAGTADDGRTAATARVLADGSLSDALSPVPDPRQVAFGIEPLRAASSPAYSPAFGGGGSIFFHADARGGSRLLRADTDDSGNVIAQATLVDDGSQNYHVSPSPDGRMLAFDSDRDGERGVYVADADGHDVRRVSGAGYAAVPRWSPDGRRLAIIRGEPDRPNIWNLWVLDLASGEQQQLTRYTSGQVWPGTWFSDNQRLAFTHDDTVFVLDTVSGGLRGYTSPVAGRLVRTAAVAPDDRHVAFQVYRDGVWILDTFTHSMHRALADRSAEEFAWSPDGKRLAFHSRRGGRWGVWLMPVAMEDEP